MNTSREKTSNVMGITVSVLLHGIFLAGCLALDAASLSSTPPSDQETTEIHHVEDQTHIGKVKS
ncbi:MAG TPA: hypothetical protein VGK46_04915 [Saprospiraceae bacterium]|jgi:hypothetical protein